MAGTEIVLPAVERIVPGHGPLSTKTDVREMKEYLVLFDAKARELASKSQDAEAVAGEEENFTPSVGTLPKDSLA